MQCSDDTVYRILDKLNVRKIEKFKPKFNDEEIQEVIDLYVNQKWSAEQLAKKYNTQHNIIIKYLKDNGIKTRGLSESQWNYNNKEFPDILLDKSQVEELYVNQRMTKKDMGLMFNCEPEVIDRILKMHGIHVRNNSESKVGMFTGEKHPNWKGGISTLDQRCREFFQVNLAPKVRERDWYSCQLCGSKKDLHVHHIETFSSIMNEIISEHPDLDVQKDIEELYDIITHDERFLSLENLITFCKRCHFFKIHCYKERSTSSQAS